MSGISLVDMSQIMTLMISIAEVLFFGFHLSTSAAAEPIWEPFWVTMVEVVCYIVQIASSSYRFEMKDGALINVVSPLAWCLACPVAMSFMMRIAWPEVSNRINIALIMNLEAVILLGMLSGMTNNMAMKITLFVCAFILYVFLVSFLLRGMFYSGKSRPKEAQYILLFFLATWMLFPVVWLLGPNMLGAWSYELTLTFFAFGDLFSKNVFTFIGFKYTQTLELKKLDDGKEVEMQSNGLHSNNHYGSGSQNGQKQMCLEDGYGNNMHRQQPQTKIDSLLLAKIIEHVQHARNIRDNSDVQQRSANLNTTPQQENEFNSQQQNGQQNLTQNNLNNKFFPSEYPIGSLMTGIIKETEKQISFTIVNSTKESTGIGVSMTVVVAKNNATGAMFEFTVMRSENFDVFCDIFRTISVTRPSQNSNVPSMTTPERHLERNFEYVNPSLAEPSPPPAFANGNDIANKSSFNFNNMEMPQVSPALNTSNTSNTLNKTNDEANLNKDLAFQLASIPAGTTLYAWKNGESSKLTVKNSKTIAFGNDESHEAYVIMTLDEQGKMDTTVIVVMKEDDGSLKVIDCKFSNITFDNIDSGYFPALKISSVSSSPSLKKSWSKNANGIYNKQPERNRSASYGA